MILPTYLVIGIVADICIGRYRIIVASLYCAFLGWIIVLFSYYVSYCTSQTNVTIILLAILDLHSVQLELLGFSLFLFLFTLISLWELQQIN